ncbi:hypothetical protein H310_05342 [Aphanomyces invadans]|uniref:Selenoprotein T n=1 Tax=Aphanomyces invadans TaxID=157072 RepID=A0A024U9J0_9STRA|nr:hypothetical protein H310_05342 [Aphanomyces invadans]ETW02870.1 hypothetical protein H310_05342 [Aphanomyces invadans]|eukprot:XP_008868254.1 hypothetical protein H310_05342 [Aphanomyces invadans]
MADANAPPTKDVELAKSLESIFPQLAGRIQGKVYTPSGQVSTVATTLSLLRWIGLTLVLFGEFFFITLGVPFGPALFDALKEHRFIATMVFMAIGVISQNLSSSGAFEVYLNDKRIFSKLESHRAPTTAEVVGFLVAKGLKKGKE